MEKKIELRKVPCGETFAVFGEEFVALGHADGGVLSIRKGIWKKAPFDTGGKNDFRDASVLKVLGDFIDVIEKNGVSEGNLLPLHIDLKATDGTRTYGYLDTSYIGLLTLEQYGKYKDIIPLADDHWWLASPVWTPWLHSPLSNSSARAWFVFSDGGCNYYGCSDVYGVRPTLNFDSSLLVSLTGAGDDSEDEKKSKAWDAYLEYLGVWAKEHSGKGFFGMTPACFDEWHGDEYDPEEEW